MHLLCLMPTYGRKPELLNNTLACFQHQTYRHKTLLIYDDLGNLHRTKVDLPGVHLVSSTKRADNLGHKYNQMLEMADSRSIPYDAVVVWDDDDIYLPKHLENHAKALQQAMWSKPTRVITDVSTTLENTDSAGRFHGSIAVMRDIVEDYPWIETERATFDQEFMQQLSKPDIGGEPGDPCEFGPPQYIYRWGSAGVHHASGLMGRETWYADFTAQYSNRIPRIFPQFDASGEKLVNSEMPEVV